MIIVFTDSSSEIATERFPFEMFLIAPSTKSCKEMLSSYCTLFPLKVQEFEAFDSVFSFLSCDCVEASLSSRSRLKAANFSVQRLIRTYPRKEHLVEQSLRRC